jgi:hypothetical protein
MAFLAKSPPGRRYARSAVPINPEQRIKSFLLLFFKKEVLSFGSSFPATSTEGVRF